jgi:Protein of unknown function (DUF2785)
LRFIIAFAFSGFLAAAAAAQQGPDPCPPPGWRWAQLEVLKRDKFALTDAAARRSLALGLTGCLDDPNPRLRDGIAFEALSTWMRAGVLDRQTLGELRDRLMPMLANPDAQGFRGPFAALVMAEVARTDRINAWLSTEERDALVEAAAKFLTGIQDYRAFSNAEGFRHGVAHGADFALQLALNPAVVRPQLDRLLVAIATQVAPRQIVSYHAGEPDRLARPVLFIAQRGLHTDDEWKAWFGQVLSPKPMAAWDAAFSTEAGLAKRHNVRAFLLSVYASASASENAGVRQLLPPIREGLKLLP